MPAPSVFRRFRLTTLLAITASLFLHGQQLSGIANDPGLGWHVATGRTILQNHSVPRGDPFLAPLRTPLGSVAPTGIREWVCDQWLADVLLALGLDAGGWPFLYSSAAALYLTAFFCFLFPALRNRGIPALAAVLASALAYKVGQVHFIIRPVLFSILMFSGLYYWLARWDSEHTPSRSDLLRRALCVTAFFAIWANLHPAFALGLLLLGLVPVAALIRGEHRKAASLSILLCAGVLGSLCTPFTWRLHESVLTLGSNSYFMNLNSEWRPPDLESPEGRLLCLCIGAPLVALALRAPLKRLSWCDVLASFLFLCGAVRSVRFLPFAGLVSAAPLAIALTAITKKAFGSLGRAGRSLEDHEARYQCVAPAVAAISVVAIVYSLATGHVPLYRGAFGPSDELFPKRALEYLTSSPDASIVIAHPNWGGYITWHGDSKVRAIIDDRNTLLGEHLYREVLPRLKTAAGLRELAQSFRATHFLLDTRSLAATNLSASDLGEVVFQDQVATLIRTALH